MPPTNIVLLNDFGHVNGGAAQVAITTALSLADRGLSVYYYYAVPPIDPRLQKHEGIMQISTNQDDILANPNRFQAAAQGLWNSTSARSMKKLLSGLKPDNTILHVHGWTKALSSSSIHAAINLGFPIIFTVHDYFLACPNGGFYNYPQDSICRLRALSPKCIGTNCDVRSYTQKLWRVMRAIIRKDIARVPSKIQHFITLSNLSNSIIRPYLPKHAQIHFLPNPIGTLKQERIPVENNKVYFAVGRLSPEKGFELFATAARILGLEIGFIGDGPMRNDLEKIYPEAIFYGWLSKDKIYQQLRRARALVLCSKSYEAQGLVVSEAASMGIPGVVSDITASKELIIDNDNGLLFQANNQDDLVEKLSILQDDVIASRLSHNSYDRFWQNPPSYQKYTDELIKIYMEMLDNPVKSFEMGK